MRSTPTRRADFVTRTRHNGGARTIHARADIVTPTRSKWRHTSIS